jgi:hypothetical protein
VLLEKLVEGAAVVTVGSMFALESGLGTELGIK